ncbi:MAG: cysteine desulfurase family protein [Candidatus Neomarinimicrobiota bacterium]
MNTANHIKREDFIYCDYAATGPLRPEVQDVMAAAQLLPGNPSSIHRPGQAARVTLERARREVAQAINAPPKAIRFTSGGTEANNTVLAGVLRSGDHVVTSQIEHPSVSAPLEALARRGVKVTAVPADSSGRVPLERIAAACLPETRLISIMTVNNETGAINDLAAVGKLATDKGVLVHTDAVQAFGKLPIDGPAWGVHFLSASAHKIGGPKGVGLLFIRPGTTLPPMILGGSQENGGRGGTENVAGAVGFARAVQLAVAGQADLISRLTNYRELFLEHITKAGVAHEVNGCECFPGVLNLRFPGIPGQAMVINLDAAGVAASYGSSCASGSANASHVLRAMGLSSRAALESVRFSFGYGTNEDQVSAAARIVCAVVSQMSGSAALVDDALSKVGESLG